MNVFGKDSKRETNKVSNNASDPLATDKSPSLTSMSVDSKPTGYGRKNPSVVKRRATGKHNALKHGIFAKVVLLSGEPRKNFDSLLNGFRSDRRPVGQLEEFLVDKLALLAWRYCCAQIAEQAEIQRGTTYSGWDEFVRNDPSAEIFLRGEGTKNEKPGLIVGMDNPVILARCVEQLQLLRNLVERRGLNQETDMKILKTVYGDPLPNFSGNKIVAHYTFDFEKSPEAPEWVYEKQARKEGTSPEEVKAKFAKMQEEGEKQGRIHLLKLLEEEIDKLKANKGLIEKVTALEDKVAQPCRSVLDSPNLDRLLRYEASLERGFDRTLNQLERIQRMRQGQAVPAPISVNVSAS